MNGEEKEIVSRETATEAYLKSLDPSLWNKIFSLSTEGQDERWFALTQSHLTDYQAGKLGSEEFKKEELELLYLNHAAAKVLPGLAREIPQRGFITTPEQKFMKFGTFGNLVDIIKRQAQQGVGAQEPFRILVGGIGISGKATVRTVLGRELFEQLPEKRVISWDRDYEKIFPPPWSGDIEVIEDVHGLDEGLERFDGQEGLPGGYNLVVYVLSPKLTYRQTLMERGASWVRAGKIDLTAPEKQASDDVTERVKETAGELERTLKVGQSWFREHMAVLTLLRRRGVKIAVVDPTRLFKELYGFKEMPALADESFLEILEKQFHE